MRSYSRISQHFMKPESSLPCSQKPSTCLSHQNVNCYSLSTVSHILPKSQIAITSHKAFYAKCQSTRVLPSSQSARRIAAPSCIGPAALLGQEMGENRPTDLHREATSSTHFASRHGHQGEPARSPPSRDRTALHLVRYSTALHSVQYSDGLDPARTGY
jgi:hypothetical protein